MEVGLVLPKGKTSELERVVSYSARSRRSTIRLLLNLFLPILSVVRVSFVSTPSSSVVTSLLYLPCSHKSFYIMSDRGCDYHPLRFVYAIYSVLFFPGSLPTYRMPPRCRSFRILALHLIYPCSAASSASVSLSIDRLSFFFPYVRLTSRV